MNAHVKPTPRPVAFQGDLSNLPEALAPLKELPNWVCWKWEWKVNKRNEGKWTKPPFNPARPQSYAKNNDPTTWGTYEQALAVFRRGECDGIGINLSNTDFPAFDIDTCRDPAADKIAPEAMKLVDRASSYTECTVSGTGLRIIGRGNGSKIHRRQKIPNSQVEVESYSRAERYIVVSGKQLPNTWPNLADISAVMDDVVAELDGKKNGAGFDFNSAKKQSEQTSGRAKSDFAWLTLPEKLRNLILNGPAPTDDHSDEFHHAVCWLWDCGWSAADIEEAIAGKPIVPGRFANRLRGEIERCLGKAKPKQDAGNSDFGSGQSTQQPPQPFELFWHGKKDDRALRTWLAKDLIPETGAMPESG